MKVNVSEAARAALLERLGGTADPALKEFLERLQPAQRAPQLTADELDAVLGAVHLRLKQLTRELGADPGRAPGALLEEKQELDQAVPKLEIMHARQTEREEAGVADG